MRPCFLVTCGHVTELAAKVDMVTLGVMEWWWQRIRQKLGLLCELHETENPSQ